MNCHLVDGWAGGGGTSRRMSGQPKCGSAKCGKAERAILGRGAQTGFPVVIALVVPKTSRATEVRMVCVSN